MQYPALKVKSIYVKLLVIIGKGFDITDQLLIRFFCIHQVLEEKSDYNEAVHQLFKDLEKGIMEVLCNILIEFGVPKKLVRLITMCLNETYSKVSPYR
jgi:hypothetical protein